MTKKNQEEKVDLPVGKNLYERLFNVFSQISRDGVNMNKMESKNLNYKFLAEAVVTEQVNALFVQQRIMLIPTLVKDVSREFQTITGEFNGKATYSNRQTTCVSVEYNVVNIDNPEETIKVAAVGEGADSLDKAVSKAMTAALKVLWRHMFLIPAPQGEDPDTTPSPQFGNSSPKATTTKPKVSKPSGDSDKLDGSYLMTFGKHKGKTIEQIYSEEEKWLDWALEKLNNEDVKEAIKEYLKTVG